MKNPLAAPSTSNVKADSSFDWRSSGTPGVAGAISPRAFGSFGIPYTTVRVQASGGALGASTNTLLSSSYPYRTIGKLTFTVPGSGTSSCSASLIMRSVIVTAAHCVAGFGSNAFYSNWTFRPGHWGATGATAAQIAPYGAWTMATGRIATAWLNGSDTGIGAARNNDVAVFIVQKNANNQFIGDQLGGWMSYGWNNYSFVTSSKTGNLHTAAVSTLGYPGLMDAGAIMQRTDGPTYTTTVGGALQLWQGSNLTGGASGGPWIVNLGFASPVLSGGAVAGSAAAPNRVIGVTSWGSINPNTPKDNYSSQFAQNAQFPNGAYGIYGAGNIGALLEALCTSKPAGSASTYAALGFCNF
ncbi:trypsin-like serine protease [Aestuariivirga sp.]|uniref:trypsin-like serine peptidase n=1 Tax=Aestuariivirga sp. TaxID=2650926 RepID=UPI0025C6D7B4|nr:trypsin-like serine protease [Aestuariivirga sp.]